MSGPHKLDDPKKGRKAVTMLAKGQSKTKVARELGVGVSSVSRWTKRDDVKTRIEEQARRYVTVLPAAVTLSTNLINAARGESVKIKKKKRGEGETIDYKILEMGQREAESLRKSTGIQPTATPSQIVQNVFFGSDTALSPILEDLLRAHLGQLVDVTEETPAAVVSPEVGTEN